VFEVVSSVILSLDALDSAVLTERQLGFRENFVHTWFGLEQPPLMARHIAGENLN
jgi:hypothetical protein